MTLTANLPNWYQIGLIVIRSIYHRVAHGGGLFGTIIQKSKNQSLFPQNNLSPSLTNQRFYRFFYRKLNKQTCRNPIDEINKTKWEWPLLINISYVN